MKILPRSFDQNTVEQLCKTGIDPVLARLYSARGVNEAHLIQPTLKNLFAPHGETGLAQLDKAAQFLANALAEQKKMLVIADYDCDGATSCAVALRGLRMMNGVVDYLVPNRFEHGYGLTPAIVDLAKERFNPDILITVDNGIASIEGVARANELGIEVVITDHHLPAENLPKAAVIVNPNQPGCPFPSKNLAGVGVIFYVLLALRAELRKRGVYTLENQPRLDNLLDLVALGTVADLVQLDANNRILVNQGLQKIRSGKMHAGIAALLQVAGRDAATLTPTDIGFTIAPRLNAAGRLEDMSIGIECLLTDDLTHALTLADHLNRTNEERRAIETEMHLDALNQLTQLEARDRYTLTMAEGTWHQGVIGILASRLKERYHRPVIVFGGDDGQFLKGSGRSITGFHLRDAIDLITKRHPGLIERFGGHAMAAGLTIKGENIETFTKAFEEIGKEWLTPEQLQPMLFTDGSLELKHYSLNFATLLKNQVWGQGFPEPIFYDQFTVVQQRLLKDKHLKLVLRKDQHYLDAIWFNHNQNLSAQAQIAYRLDINTYQGSSKVQLLVEYAHA